MWEARHVFWVVAASSAGVVDLANAIAWPVAVVVSVLLLREPLARVLGRTTKITAFQVSLELAAVPEFQTPKGTGGPFALRQPAAGREFPSGAPALFNEIANPSTAEYVVIDLGDGDHWLTSRVFIFSVLLERMRGLQCVVFLETAPRGRRQFLGLATPEHIRWSFASHYPWLEAAFAQAYANSVSPGPPSEVATTPVVSPPNGALPADQANLVVAQYLSSTQSYAEPVSPEWIKLSEQTWEHAKWLNGPRLERLLDVLLERSWIEQQPGRSADDEVAAVIAQDGRFVALCEPGGRFRGLIDRDALVQEAAKRV
jgi:hypothetical protein